MTADKTPESPSGAGGYAGFEQGPIRPPSEAFSLLIRVTRNCPWNRCRFCPVYKGTRFSLRPVEHVKRDIDAVHRCVALLSGKKERAGGLTRATVNEVLAQVSEADFPAFQAAVHWMSGRMNSIFLQDANSLIIRPEDLIAVLRHLKTRFPFVERITSYARSHTVARIRDEDLKAMREAGLNRIHIGLESGSDQVLALMNKGVTKEMHVKAGRKVKNAGIELSEYVMPGLGGRTLSEIHALETADALNLIDPDFIRLRSLAIPNSLELFEDWEAGRFHKCTDRMVAAEILTLLENLEGITSRVKSDHILNLFEEIDGRLPGDKARMTGIIRRYLDMDPEIQCLYQVGRRLGLFSRLSDIEDPPRRERAEAACREFAITPANVDEVIDELMKRFI